MSVQSVVFCCFVFSNSLGSFLQLQDGELGLGKMAFVELVQTFTEEKSPGQKEVFFKVRDDMSSKDFFFFLGRVLHNLPTIIINY